MDNVAHQEPDSNVRIFIQIALDQEVMNKGFHYVRAPLSELSPDEALNDFFSISQYGRQGCGRPSGRHAILGSRTGVSLILDLAGETKDAVQEAEPGDGCSTRIIPECVILD